MTDTTNPPKKDTPKPPVKAPDAKGEAPVPKPPAAKPVPPKGASGKSVPKKTETSKKTEAPVKDAKGTAKKPTTTGGKKPGKSSGETVEIVEKPTPKKHVARPKPQLTKEQEAALHLRRLVAQRRPKRFQRQQWYEYKRLANSGWRKPTGVDSAMRRHFGYEQPVVRVGFRGPAAARGLHPSGFQEVHVEQASALAQVDPKTQAVRFSRTLGTRKLKLLYAEADKLGVRILNRRNLK